MSSGRRNKKSKSKLCSESYSIKRRQQERAFQAHYLKAAASGGGSLLLALGGLFVALAVFLFARQGDGGGTPSITVDQQLIDYGDVKFNVEKTFVIKVTNTGDGTLRFKEDPYIEVVEGC